MNINYNKLWKLMIDQNMNKTQLKNAAHLSTNVIAKLGKNRSVSIDTLGKICMVLRCNIGDIVDIVPDNDKEEQL
ncbi:helix-turn-helix domain-containing protein [Clostridium intestinale]|uniref:DNA-binding transcriptional regulator, XRE family n=1 Tax=Clostridium intestinale DSM 6191 TaxID=1121320 RepID=A0A1M5T1R1_9CLOT|nr:helix-turn-helix transcriptional regulator [Clostridium intestinale]SHH44303.1 DNA-binding transcriptional regulator, XRE family [Clostridium intestinale DSM 6191]